MDVFSLALILVEMLAGHPARTPADPVAAMRRAATVPVTLPQDLGDRADAHLRAILAEALAHEPAQRTASAQALREALVNWLDGIDAGANSTLPMPLDMGAGTPSAGQGTLEFLWRRMRHKSDFPRWARPWPASTGWPVTSRPTSPACPTRSSRTWR
jgi:hypothetical protein